MNRVHGLTRENLVRTLPLVLQNDPNILALADSIAASLSARPKEIDNLRIYTRIDELPDVLLDILAFDFKIDWWNGDYSTEEKRKTLKGSWRVRHKLGTKAAVETAISAIYPNAKVREWWQYDGDPYHFKLAIEIGDELIEIAKSRQVLQRIQYYKNLRSVLDGVSYIVKPLPIFNPPPVFILRDLLLHLRFFSYGGSEHLFLNGQKVLDGTWLLNQMLRGVNFRELVFCMPRFLEGESLAGAYFTPGVLSLPNRFGSIQLALAAFLIRLPNYFDLSFVWLNGQRVLDGSWLLNQAVHGLYFPQFALQTALSEEERLADRMHLMLNPLVLRSNTESFQLDQMAFWLRFANYFDLSFVWLNGRRLVDGSWLLNQEVHGLYFPNLALHTALSEEEHLAKQIHLTLNPLALDSKTERFQLGRMAVCLRFAKHFACGVACDALALTTAFQEAERLSACIKTKLTMQTVADLKTRLSAQSKLSEQTRIQAARLATGPWRIQTASKLSACTITQDSMWRLDGKRLCDGRYKLNANIIKETI